MDESVHIGSPFDYDATKLDLGDEALEIDDIDYVEIYAANARQATYFYASSFGFQPVAYRGPETGSRPAASYVLEQGKARLVITGPIMGADSIVEAVTKHGDTVHSVAFRVQDCAAFFEAACKRGAKSFESPTLWKDETGEIIRAGIHTYGDTVHSIVDRTAYKGTFWPGFVPINEVFPDFVQTESINLARIDHVVGNVELGKMNQWVKFYQDVLGFTQMKHFTDEDISTEYSALMSKVMRNDNGKIKFPINEPAEGKRKSQIEEYLEFHNGPGVQHIAMLTGDIIGTVTEMRKRGISFLRVPTTYYDVLADRVGKIDENLEAIAKLGILVDRDDDGYLLQIFTKPVHDRPTLFFEIIQRHGSQGFGIGNFKALFESIEQEQALRGNL